MISLKSLSFELDFQALLSYNMLNFLGEAQLILWGAKARLAH